MGRLPTYLIVRTSERTGRRVFYWKRRVPADLVPIIGQAVWRESLTTTDQSEAIAAARQLTVDSDEMILRAKAELRRQRALVARLTVEERDRIVDAGGLAAFREATEGKPGPPSTFQRAFYDPKTKRTTVREFQSPSTHLAARTRIAEATAEILASVREATSEEDELALEVAEAEARAKRLREQLERNRAILVRAGQKVAVEAAEDGQRPETADLHTIVTRWAKDSGAPDQHVEQYRHPVDRFYELHGPVKLKDIKKAHLRDFKDALEKLPRSTRRDIRTATMRRAIAIADREHLPRIAAQTVAKHMTALSTLMRLALGWGYIEANPADGFKTPRLHRKHAVARKERRQPFTPEQMTALAASLAAEYKVTEDDYWVPLFAAYQGARVEEVTQLRKSDVRKDAQSGLWVVDITDEGEGQKVKNASSHRTIPLHPMLIQRGFLDHHARAPDGGRLFPSLKPDQRGRYGGPYGKRFARHLLKRTKIKTPGLTFHSLRHTWLDAARNAGVPLEVRHVLTGHSHDTPVAQGYGAGYSPEVLLRELQKVEPFAGR